ncbi:MAG: Fe-S cluster assembly protein SufD [Opitutales bacterium]
MSTLLEQPAFSQTATGEPDWLTERRRNGHELFERLPMPSAKDEMWRFASVGRLSIEGFAPVTAIAQDKREALAQRSSLVSERAGRLVHVDDALAAFEPLDPELTEKGVVYLPLAQAIKERPDLLEDTFLRESTGLGSRKFFGLHASRVHAGCVLYIPKGVVIDKPIVNYHWSSAPGAAVFPHTLVIAEDNAEVAVVDVFFSDTTENEALSVGVSNIHAGAGARIFRKVIQNWNEKTVSFQLDTTVAERDSQVKNLAVNIGAERARFENQVRIEGPGADVKMYSLTVAEERQEFDQRTHQIHNAPNSFSDLLYKNALLDNSRTIFSGLIQVAENAQQTDAYQTNRNLLLDPTAESNALPGLEIQANDVKCSHGATTGNVDEDQIFYMMSRGIPRRIAMQLMVFGFFEEVIRKVESEELAENLRGLIRGKFQSKIRNRGDN